MRMLSADEHRVALLNLAVPSPIFRDTEPIFVLLLPLPSPKRWVCEREREREESCERVRFVKWSKWK